MLFAIYHIDFQSLSYIIMKNKLSAMVMAGLLTLGASAQNKQMKAYMVSDAHLDTQWNWDVQATIRDHIRNTLEQNLFLIKQYPHYIFNFEGGVKYAWMKEYYPRDYEELKRCVAAGRWHITGSSWDANETIICSPESWLRNVLLGQTFYRREFQTEGTDIFLPDCFGFGYTLPTLAAHCGLIGFSSQKLVWRTKPFYDGGKRYPFTIGLWQGIDGSRIMMTHGFSYGQRWSDADLSENASLQQEIKESPLNMVYRYYGTGDVGGSPDIASVRAVEKGINGNGPVQIISATSDQLYKDFMPFDQHPELPVFNGELPMDVHGNGCYTSQAAMKLYNRQNEHLGDAAERASVMADWLGMARYPGALLTDTWQRVIWHQFHDDVTGTSIPRAYEFSWNDEILAMKKFSDVLTHSVSAVSRRMNTQTKGKPVAVFNNEAFTVGSVAEVMVEGRRDYTVVSPEGKKVRSQVIERDGRYYVLFDAEVPSTGLAIYDLRQGGNLKPTKPLEGKVIESSRYILEVNDYGDIVSLMDKKANKQLVQPGKSLRLVVFDDCRSARWPAWEIQKATLDKEPVPVHGATDIYVEKGALRQTLVVKKRYGESDIMQRIHLYEGNLEERIDIENVVDWRSSNALLKAEFALNVANEEAAYDIGLGHVRRGNNKDHLFEVYAHQWTDLTDRSGAYGVTLLNDSRYGWDKPDDHTLRLSLLYSPKPERAYAYQAVQDYGHHVFTYSIVGHEGMLDAPKAVRRSDVLNSPLKTFFVDKHQGTLGNRFSFVSTDNDQIVVRALKQAEVSDEVVVRVYEMGGKATQHARLSFAGEIVKAVEADGTERTRKAISFDGHSLDVEVNPFGVRTYKVTFAKQSVSPTDMQILPLSFDRHCFSFNEFRSAANFEGGYSYAAELLPDEGITVGDVPFRFGEKDAANGVTCKGKTISWTANKDYRHLYLLIASDQDDRIAEFKTGNSVQKFCVPYYTGFIGQWGHDNHTEGFVKEAEVAYVGSHRHSTDNDEPYEFTYMFRICIDLPKGVRQVTLPDDEHVVVFAATLANDAPEAVPAAPLFKTSLREANQTADGGQKAQPAVSLLKNARIVAVSGEVNDAERATNLTDGRDDTKWCDAQQGPNYVAFDLGKPTLLHRWHLINAACEHASYITRTCLLQGRNSETEEWQTLDMFDGNRKNIIDRFFTPTSVRYVRLFVINPTQGSETATRIYEFDLY
jgi:alpha-mannosidase